MSRFAELPEDSADETFESPQPAMIPGNVVILVVATLGFLGAAGAWLYHYNAQRKPLDYWGFDSHRIMASAPTVTASLVHAEPATSDPARKIWYPELFPIGFDRFVLDKQLPVQDRPGLNLETHATSLREALRHYRSYDWNAQAWARPNWRYALTFEEEDVTNPGTKHELKRTFRVTLVFDDECRFVRLQSVEKQVGLVPEIQEQFRQFFTTVFPDSATPSAGDATAPKDQPVLTLPTPVPSSTPLGLQPPAGIQPPTTPTPSPSSTQPPPLTVSPTGGLLKPDAPILGGGGVKIPAGINFLAPPLPTSTATPTSTPTATGTPGAAPTPPAAKQP